jgi:hypothetical protein
MWKLLVGNLFENKYLEDQNRGARDIKYLGWITNVFPAASSNNVPYIFQFKIWQL